MCVERTWAGTFSRFSPGRIPLVGSIAVLVADWSRPRRGEAPMFEQSWLERFSLAHPAVPFAFYAPAGLWFAWRGWAGGQPLSHVIGAYGAGLLLWSLVEYLAHRASFHHAPTSPLQVAFGYVMHGVHHAYPDDSRRWVMPIGVTLPIAVVFYVLFMLSFGRSAPTLFGGFLHGYLTYDLIHYFIHRGGLPGRVGRYLRQYHLAHHYAAPDRHFGVSSPLWDVVFRTR